MHGVWEVRKAPTPLSRTTPAFASGVGLCPSLSLSLPLLRGAQVNNAKHCVTMLFQLPLGA